MTKQYFDVDKIKLDETGRTVLDEKQLTELGESSKAGAGFWQDLEEWWNTNNGRCVNNFICGEETNNGSCRNGLDCDLGSNLGGCYNENCDGTENPSSCMNIESCVGTDP